MAAGEEEEEFTPHLTLFKTSKDRDAVMEANKYVRSIALVVGLSLSFAGGCFDHRVSISLWPLPS
jgi:hypothetical protein